MCSWSVVVFIKSTARLKSDIEDCRTNVDLLLAQLCNFNLNLLIMTKGQLISECLFDVLNFQKKNNEKFDKLLSHNLKSGQIRK